MTEVPLSAESTGLRIVAGETDHGVTVNYDPRQPQNERRYHVTIALNGDVETTFGVTGVEDMNFVAGAFAALAEREF